MPDAVVAPLHCRSRGHPARSLLVTAWTASAEPVRPSASVPSTRLRPSRSRGTPSEYVRKAASGGNVRSYFCTHCGSTVYWKADNLPGMIGVAVGAMADPNFPAPLRSVFEQSKHGWVEINGAEHFQQSSAKKNAS
ncbi:hypothetical protein ACVW0J_004966 [Bradyrhizobium sp. i1.7.7]